MKELVLKQHIKVYETVEELSDIDRQLLQRAKEALNDSYSPYSNFKVGAALLLKNGEIIGGSNQENASYPLCLCAERVAISAADAMFNGIPILAIAVTVKNPKQVIKEPASPCGACRQVMCETEMKHRQNMRVLLQGEIGEIYEFESAKGLLPLSFDGSYLD